MPKKPSQEIVPVPTEEVPLLELELRLRNNRLKARRRRLGLSQKAFCAKLGINASLYGQLESLRMLPIDTKGQWRSIALTVAKFWSLPPEELWPPVLLEIVKPVATKEVGEREMQALLTFTEQYFESRTIPVEELPDQRGAHALLQDLLEQLPEREKRVLTARFGLDGEPVQTLDELGRELGVSRERVRGIESAALVKLRRSELKIYAPDAADLEIARHELKSLQWATSKLLRRPYVNLANIEVVRGSRGTVFHLEADNRWAMIFNWSNGAAPLCTKCVRMKKYKPRARRCSACRRLFAYLGVTRKKPSGWSTFFYLLPNSKMRTMHGHLRKCPHCKCEGDGAVLPYFQELQLARAGEWPKQSSLPDLPIKLQCEYCEGRGCKCWRPRGPDSYADCQACHAAKAARNLQHPWWTPCPECAGTGYTEVPPP